jgi:hypothetical protein
MTNTDGEWITCSYCLAPLHIDHPNPVGTSLKYHPKCKRAHDRETRDERMKTFARDPRENVCESCGQLFLSKRSDAKFCSPRCRTAHYRSIRKASQ